MAAGVPVGHDLRTVSLSEAVGESSSRDTVSEAGSSRVDMLPVAEQAGDRNGRSLGMRVEIEIDNARGLG